MRLSRTFLTVVTASANFLIPILHSSTCLSNSGWIETQNYSLSIEDVSKQNYLTLAAGPAATALGPTSLCGLFFSLLISSCSSFTAVYLKYFFLLISLWEYSMRSRWDHGCHFRVNGWIQRQPSQSVVFSTVVRESVHDKQVARAFKLLSIHEAANH